MTLISVSNTMRRPSYNHGRNTDENYEEQALSWFYFLSKRKALIRIRVCNR